ncbi:hypothetical protein Wildcat_164 [Mycobacterium phage Wildcat]|uniref:Uncharacterized protein n=2 Tax=Mycobacterium virus Wildcat TaxID=1993859 RepID=Q19XS0_9CAUD|nr:tail length tape measure protein [Mycobacterium phage Wildcat]ABE67744.1 hypothetical protein Wildcat_164 [Mycobacterium phage Wildcat]QGJ90022.1 hypothetical protein PBI_MARYV_150 [Mycobacterium phage MaryV]
MKTAIENLFVAMVSGGWFTASSGDVESPTGHFAYVTNLPTELASIRDAFEEEIETYGDVSDDELTGSFVVRENTDGLVFIETYGSNFAARLRFEELEAQYEEWLNR